VPPGELRECIGRALQPDSAIIRAAAMDDEILSVTGRSVPRVGPSTYKERLWLWNSICPLVFLPRYIFRHDWIGVAMWLFVLAAGLLRSRQPVVPLPTRVKVLWVSVVLVSGGLVFIATDPTWRIAGLALAPVLFFIAFALEQRAQHTNHPAA
jgi:hypothetical protein